MVGVALTVAGWFASSIIGKLIDGALAYVKDHKQWRSAMAAELERLKMARPQIEAIVDAAENGDLSGPSSPLEQWLWQLKDAVEDADNLFDEMSHRTIEQESAASPSKWYALPFSKRTAASGPILERLREVVKRFDDLASKVGAFAHIIGSLRDGRAARRAQWRYEIEGGRETGSLLAAGELLGRDNERTELVLSLTRSAVCVDGSNCGGISVVSVLGIGGVGKTALAQRVFDDREVEGFFDLKMWVCVLNAFEPTGILKKMWESATKAKTDVETLDSIQRNLKEMLMTKKFLLVLDDVWNDQDETAWDNIIAPLRYGRSGSKILLTTRMRSVVEMVGSVAGEMSDPLNLKGLEENDYLMLFNKYAFGGANPGNHKKLQIIAKEIAKRLGGIPLAAKTVGGILRKELSDEHWTRICEGQLLKLEQGNDGIMPILRLSYQHLPAELQRCFRYCSIFPRNYEFKKEELVRMWMAVGLIEQNPNEDERPEDIGGWYFESLVRKSFFEHKHHLYYVMHDLLHDVAQFVSANECLSIVGNLHVQIPESVRHLSVKTDDLSVIKMIPQLQYLRTLFLHCDRNDPQLDYVVGDMLKGLTNLRLLRLFTKFMLVLPDSTGDLIHLRYLHIGQNNVSKLPPSICRLYHLQALRVRWNIRYKISKDSIPAGINNLVKLQSISSEVISMIREIGKLTSLEALIGFSVKEEAGYRITELEKMSELQELIVTDLENVQSPQEAAKAKLNTKAHLAFLSLRWNTIRNVGEDAVNLDEQLLDCLQPHSNLKHLGIFGYKGRRSPHWMVAYSLSSLTSVDLVCCDMWETLPPFGDLPFLKALILEEMKAVKQIGLQFYGTGGVSSAFPSLELLQFQNMEGLEHWYGGTEDEQWFPCLRRLVVTGCPKLRRLPPIPLSLKELEISFLEITTLPRLWMPPNQSSSNISSPSSLSSITILWCSNLKSLAEGLFQDPEHLMLLEDLTIWDCYELVHLPVEGFEKFVSLKRLAVQGCEKLLLLPMIPDNFLPPSIHYLTLKSCGDLDVSLPRLLHGLTSLSFLKLDDCFNLTSLPAGDVLQRLTALTCLIIQNCRELTSPGGLEFLPSLKILEIKKCRKLVTVAEVEAEALSLRAVEIPSLALDRLDIDDPSLLLLAPLRSLTSTKSVDIKGCSNILALPDRWLLQNRAALQAVALYDAVLLRSLPDSLQCLSSLQLLVLRNAHQLQRLPELPRCLKTLDISGCHPALDENYKRDGGSDWHKIAHVSDVIIAPIRRA